MVTSVFASNGDIILRFNDTTGTEENAPEKDFTIIKDSLNKIFDSIKKESDNRINRFKDSLLAKSFKDADSILPAAAYKSFKEYAKVVDDKKSNLKLYITGSTDALKTTQRIIVAAFFKALTDSSVDEDICAEVSDSLNSTFDEATESIADSTTTLLDGFSEYIDEIHQIESTKPGNITIGLDSYTHNQTNMRDDGLNQFIATPSISAILPLGFTAGFSIGYYSDAITKWDGASQYLTYTLSVGKQTALYTTYSHFNFTATSKRRKALFSNSMATGFNYEGENLYLASGFDFYLGAVKEPTLFIDGGRPFLLTGEDRPYEITVLPELMVCWGVQDTGITAQRLKKLLPKKPATPAIKAKIAGTQKVKAKTGLTDFNILGYEFSAPLEFVYKRLALKFTPDYVIPINVVDGSSSSPYLNVSFELEYGINIFK